MNQIEKIIRVRDIGVFRSFDWPAILLPFGRYNLIYGWNASGKTTLSRVFRDLELKRVPGDGYVSLCVDGREVTGDSFPEATIPIRVFNRDYVNESVFRRDGGNLPPIFVLGRESAEKQQKIEKLNGALADAQAELLRRREQKRASESKLDGLCIDRAKVIKDTLRSSGSNAYNNYDKAAFRSRAEKMVKDGDSASWLLTEADRENLLLQHKASPKQKLPSTTYRLPDLPTIFNAGSRLLAATIVSEVIDSLRKDPNLSDWVRRGLKLHQDRHAQSCLFCEQSLPEDRLLTLQAHFSEEYENLQRRLDDQIDELSNMSRAAASLDLPKRAELYEDLVAEYEQAEQEVREATAAVQTFSESTIAKLNAKKTQTFDSVPLDLVVPWINGAAINRINAVIQRHNQACDDFQKRVSDARRRLEADNVAGALFEFRKLKSEIGTSDSLAAAAEAETTRLNADIESLEREIVQHRRPAEDLNQDLCNYLGHDEIRLEVKDTGYTITRNGVSALKLCEGEMTAIALLYFLKSLQDRGFDLKRGLVVLDDPVSSLDANALYLAFSYMRERTRGAGQIFILTHNFTLFRQVRNWFHHLKGKAKKDARFYMLACSRENGQRCATVQALDPLLEQYESEYHYLFARIWETARNSSPTTLEKCYLIPNMARRLLEAFLAFRHPDASGELWRKMQAVEFDEPKKLRILRFLHTYSHDDAITEPQHDPCLLREAPAVLSDLLELIKSEDAAHFSAMEHLVSVGSDREDEAAEGTARTPEAAP